MRRPRCRIPAAIVSLLIFASASMADAQTPPPAYFPDAPPPVAAAPQQDDPDLSIGDIAVGVGILWLIFGVTKQALVGDGSSGGGSGRFEQDSPLSTSRPAGNGSAVPNTGGLYGNCHNLMGC